MSWMFLAVRLADVTKPSTSKRIWSAPASLVAGSAGSELICPRNARAYVQKSGEWPAVFIRLTPAAVHRNSEPDTHEPRQSR